MIMLKKAGCPKGYTRKKGVCVSKPTPKGGRFGGRLVLLGFDIVMDNSFEKWAYVAKDRLISHLDREHASDITDGNVDYHLQAGGWKNRTIYGTIELKVPQSYWDAYTERDDFIQVGNAALQDTVTLELSHDTQFHIVNKRVVATGI
jgi:hypothetical protein